MSARENSVGEESARSFVRDDANHVFSLTHSDTHAFTEIYSDTVDSAGNVTQIDRTGRPALGLAWDIQYRLTSVSTNGTPVESYQYDAGGRRIATAIGTNVVRHVYAGMHVIADMDSSGNVLRAYTWGPGIDNLLAMTVYGPGGTNTYQAISDHLGTVHALVDDNGDTVESYRYDAWGNVLGVFDGNGGSLPSSVLGNRYLFQGREYSWATHAAWGGAGLYYFRARYYDPSTGRWLSNDPIGISGGLNQYAFCANNPVMYVDPFGLELLTEAPAPFKKYEAVLKNEQCSTLTESPFVTALRLALELATMGFDIPGTEVIDVINPPLIGNVAKLLDEAQKELQRTAPETRTELIRTNDGRLLEHTYDPIDRGPYHNPTLKIREYK